MPRTNEKLEALFGEWSELLQLTGQDGFRVRAYDRAAQAIAGLATDISDMPREDLDDLPNIGKGMQKRILEFLDTGSIAELDELREQVPSGMRDLLRVSGLGPKKAILLNTELGVASLDDLKAAIEAKKLRDTKGLGKKTEENLARSLEHLAKHSDRVLIDAAMTLAETIIAELAERFAPEKIEIAGSLRRSKETIGDIDILVAAEDAEPIMEGFCGMDLVTEILAKGPTKSSILSDSGLQVDLRVLPTHSWGAGLVYFTGSKEHNVRIREMAVKKGLRLNEWGLFDAESGDEIAAETEETVYAALGLPWIPPTMREDRGEVQAALEGSLPVPLQIEDILGDFHSHTDMTDGRAPLEEMLKAAAARGYRYYAVTDHAEDLSMTGASRGKMLAQRKRLATLQKKYPDMRILHGTELNISKEGTVDYDAEFLSGFDICVASVHSHFRLSRSETTARVLRAIENPQVHIIGHPSGRLIGRREPIDWDFAVICEAASRTGTALEVNCFPDRMDLRDEHIRYAVEHGVTLTVDTDSHAPRDLQNLRYGVWNAQRGWATKQHVLNARPLEEVLAFVAAKRNGG
ncbi:MAG: DNA polymerase/3'-5' exonuclease PolX [Actinomycetota bacterium]